MKKALRQINTKRILIYLFAAFVIYIIIITFFAFIYYKTDSISTSNNFIDNSNPSLSDLNKLSFFDAFYFSYVSFHTIGYGDYHPKNYLGKQILLFESIVSLFFVSLFSGFLVYFLLRKPKYLFMAKYVLITMIEGKFYLLFRIGNKGNALVNFNTTIEVIHIENNGRTIFYRDNKILGVLENSYSRLIELSKEKNEKLIYNLQNAIYNNSPLVIRFISMGIDESSGQTVILNHCYKNENIKLGLGFHHVEEIDNNGNVIKVNWNNFDIIKDLNNPEIIEKFKKYE